jgi:CheY-like chemotaxis protein/anti-sigma regulatory factor (Ser/Thr protein kinase)
VATLLGDAAAQKGLELVLAVPPDLPRSLIGDPLRLNRILTNLVANAVKFTERGEIVIAAETLSLTESEAELRFTVRDSGIGLTPEQQGHLFQTFFQADGSTVRRAGGAGLGLAICKRLVDLMGGTIAVDSEPGIGSVFGFTIRLGVQPGRRPAAVAERAELKGLRGLVIDDSAAVRAILSATLAATGMVVTAAAGGAEALSLAEQAADRPFDLILVDWQLPDYDGLDLALRLRALDRGRRTAIRLMVASTAKSRFEEPAGEAGFGRLLVKPLNTAQLVGAMVEAAATRSKTAPAKIPQRPVPPAQLAGAAILLVEDNEINQMVARGILEGAKMKVTIAHNGREAVAVLRQTRFDAVLMDLQMPVMDGYAATRAIRQELGLGDLPIIAVTAHALAEERRNCFDTGMNEHVSKPIDPQRLLSVLTRFVRIETPPEKRAEPAPPVAAEDRPLPGIDLADAMRRLGGNRELLDRVYAEFCEHYGNAAADIASFGPERADEARRLVHTVKGVAGNIGAKRVFQAAHVLENALHAGDDVTTPLAAFADALAECVVVAPRAPVVLAAPVEPVEIDHAVLRPLVVKLDALLRRRDLDAEDCLTALKASCAGNGLDQALRTLEAGVGALDFDAALVALAAFDTLIDAAPALEAR